MALDEFERLSRQLPGMLLGDAPLLQEGLRLGDVRAEVTWPDAFRLTDSRGFDLRFDVSTQKGSSYLESEWHGSASEKIHGHARHAWPWLCQ